MVNYVVTASGTKVGVGIGVIDGVGCFYLVWQGLLLKTHTNKTCAMMKLD